MKRLMIAVCFAFFAAAPLFAAEPPDKASSLLETLLAATQSGNYERFIEAGNAAFRAGITKDKFMAVSGQLAPRLKKGYQATYLGKLEQLNHAVYLWKLQFSDGRNDHLVKLSIKNGLVSGFWIQ